MGFRTKNSFIRWRM